jgi:peptidoglycan/LPS O-acetylase OafA/YrhL
LDLLRFIAFVSVFIAHGPRVIASEGAAAWKHQVANVLDRFTAAGIYGLSLFFFLSSYLITELLIRERESTGGIHLKQFYMRRILRIWPLYFLGVALAIAAGFLVPMSKIGNRVLVTVAILLIPAAPACLLLVSHGWYNPLTHFIFFATGGLLAFTFHNRVWRAPSFVRVLLGCAAIVTCAAIRFVRLPEFVTFLLGDAGRANFPSRAWDA